MAFQIECKCGKTLTLHNSMKGKKFKCPHCKLVISLKMKSKTANAPIPKPDHSDEPSALPENDLPKKDGGEIPVPIPQVSKSGRKPPPIPSKALSPKKNVYDEVEVVYDKVDVVHEIQVAHSEIRVAPVKNDIFVTPSRQPVPYSESVFSTARRPVRREEYNTEKTIIIGVLVALGVAFVGFAVWLFRADLTENTTSLAGNYSDENEPWDEIDYTLLAENERERRRNELIEFQKGFQDSQREYDSDRNRRRAFASDDFNRRRDDFQRSFDGNRNRRGNSFQDELNRIKRDSEREFKERQRKRKEEEARREKEVRRVFEKYQEAVALRDGKKVVALLSKDTLAAFGKFRKHALNSDKETIRQLQLTEQLMSLAIRVRYIDRKLQSMSLNDYCAQYFSEIPVEILDHGYRGVKLGDLYVFDDHASAHDNKSRFAKYVPIVYFKLEEDGWKIDFFNEKNRTDSTLALKISSAKVQSRSRLTREGFIVAFAKANVPTKNKSRRRLRSIWKPLR